MNNKIIIACGLIVASVLTINTHAAFAAIGGGDRESALTLIVSMEAGDELENAKRAFKKKFSVGDDAFKLAITATQGKVASAVGATAGGGADLKKFAQEIQASQDFVKEVEKASPSQEKLRELHLKLLSGTGADVVKNLKGNEAEYKKLVAGIYK